MNKLLKAELSALESLGLELVSQENPSAVLDGVLSILSSKIALTRCIFTMRHGDVFQIEASTDLDDGERRLGKYRLGEGITGTVAKTGVPVLVPNVSKDPRFLNRTGSRATEQEKSVAFLCVPVLYSQQIIGTLAGDSPTGTIEVLQEKLRFLGIVANLTAAAVAKCYQMIEEREALKEENLRLREYFDDEALEGIIGNSNLMRAVYEGVHQVAQTDATVLLRGSSGTGKELVAAAIHNLSERAKRPFVRLNCAALPENLFESELFGHEKGAFTGAIAQRVGRVEAAEGGTLFLDEIGDLSPASQVKILRLLQEKTYTRLGSNQERRANVRFVAATSRPLEDLIAAGKFREDLFYRLNVFPLNLPDLARRKCDIVPLAEHFIKKYNLRYHKNVKRISAPAVNLLVAYAWPGNVRELENCIERAILTAKNDCIRSYNLPSALQAKSSLPSDESAGTPKTTGSDTYKNLIDNFERELLTESLRRNNGNRSAAGRELGLSPRLMHYKVHILGLESVGKKDGDE
ncbi:MAG: sigma 54-interacting transcriptional regulator [Opitutales bacterium]|nr:sigma 54-interacting transcriptional regulator [Opitutales bacterium]